MEMVKSIITALVFSLFLFFSQTSPTFSQPMGRKPGPGMGGKPWRGEGPCWRAFDLNPSPDQVKGLEQIQQAYLRETQVLRAEIFLKRLELREILTHPASKAESILSKYSEMNQLQSKLEEKIIEYLIKVRSLLSQEQLKNWCPEQELPLFRRMMQP